MFLISRRASTQTVTKRRLIHYKQNWNICIWMRRFIGGRGIRICGLMRVIAIHIPFTLGQLDGKKIIRLPGCIMPYVNGDRRWRMWSTLLKIIYR